MTDHTPSFSISIEWENARFADLERSRRMLRRLSEELDALAPPPEPPQIEFLYDRNVIDGELIASVVAEELRPRAPAAVRITPTDGLRYYEQKNLGAARTSGEIIVFLDCDVVPDPGWLSALLGAFADPQVLVVGGETYIEIEDLWSKAFALFWFFGLRGQDNRLEPTTFFHANNVAFRREVFEAHKFPSAPMYRGQCTVLSHRLCAEGVPVLRHMGAGASHPCPRGLRHFVARALHNGRDTVTAGRLVGLNSPSDFASAFSAYRQRLWRARARIANHYRDVGLSRAGAVGAYAISAAYATFQTAGELLTTRRRGLVQRLFPM